ncbi:DNA mismatch repair protein MutS [Persicimonas caeni]|uniref:DNA mismatch repair protein MutS n=1 Tax=Persicimonas caeni TaxID=2292766 RepID=A0A4Y6PP75_PERCE|nr:DNA mismatch repair protein MutS [Persicimonas caeni]QDG50136.1 DNA mismatch repair protein MutS [Persicimonas caeni]QED31357.1 DNA mismatch repair protein MutS [Persicimonas caeni]
MKLTPMMQQYMDVKERYPDAVLFFRLGDFYEMFFEDAEVCSRELGITLTARSKGANNIPMAGVPHHAAEGYVNQLIDKGFSVAICEQVEDAEAAKGIVKRDVVRVITPGVVLNSDSLDDKAPNYVAAIGVKGRGVKNEYGIAYLDVSTGDFRVTEVSRQEELRSELNRIEPREVLVPKSAEALFGEVERHLDGVFFRPRKNEAFEPKALLSNIAGGARLSGDIDHDAYFLEAGPVEKMFTHVHDFGFESPDVVQQAASAVLDYIVETQRGIPTNVQEITPYHAQSFLVIDESTKANLELTRTLMGGRRQGSLLSVIDKTVTAMGGRRLRHWLNYPLVSLDAIRRRHDAVEELVRFPALREDIREALDAVYDIERLCGKISSGTANARDLRSLLSTLAIIPEVKEVLSECDSEFLVELDEDLDPCHEIRDLIDRAVVDDPPVELTEGGLFKAGFDDELDELLEISGNGKDWILRYETEQKQATDISSLKVKHNKVFGYFIEVTKANLHLVPDRYIRKQTLANSERYYTPELKEMEERILGAEDKRKTLEYQLFQELRKRVGLEVGTLLRTASQLANLDVIAGLSELAQRLEYTRPDMTEEPVIDIDEGRHPVVERTLKDERFVPNSVRMDPEQRLLIITGPNMAGKSTVIRQVALISLLAQMGSFVPVKAAELGVVDKIFSRVGASDNLARGQSTFMVEMTEAAHILNNATEHSLVILDEIGRGTSTFDGLSIAWAVAEHLHDEIRAKTMFATHYHELTELIRTLDGARNLSIAVKEWQDDIIFLRKLVDGEANRSYGIQVGKLAGLPEPVVERAKQVLENLEGGQFDEMGIPMAGRKPGEAPEPTRHHNPNQLTLFHGGASLSPGQKAALETLDEVDVNSLTPLEALNVLNELVQKLESS